MGGLALRPRSPVRVRIPRLELGQRFPISSPITKMSCLGDIRRQLPREGSLVFCRICPGFLAASGRTLRGLKRLWEEDKGQDLVEYGLLVFLIALAAIASMKGLASSISTVFKSAATSLTTTS